MFGKLLALVAQPRAHVRRKIERFRTERFGGRRAVGVQVRRQNRAGRDKKGAGIPQGHVEALLACAAARLHELVGPRDGVVFVASDDESTRDAAVRYFEARHPATEVVYWDEPIAASSEGMLNALVDLWLLGECDRLVGRSQGT